jgi:hypothetical protein
MPHNFDSLESPVPQTSEYRDEAETYRLDSVDHAIVAQYHPRFKGMGALQVVYDIPDHPGIVAKVDTVILRKFLIDPHREPSLVQEYIRGEQGRQAAMRKIFGNHFLPVRYAVMRVPLTRAIVASLFPDQEAPLEALTMTETLAVVGIQRKAHEIEDDSFTSLSAYSVENTMLPARDYARILGSLLVLQDGHESFEEYLSVSPIDVRELYARVDTDSRFADMMRDFITRTIRSVASTGESSNWQDGETSPSFRKETRGIITLPTFSIRKRNTARGACSRTCILS